MLCSHKIVSKVLTIAAISLEAQFWKDLFLSLRGVGSIQFLQAPGLRVSFLVTAFSSSYVAFSIGKPTPLKLVASKSAKGRVLVK